MCISIIPGSTVDLGPEPAGLKFTWPQLYDHPAGLRVICG